MSLGITGPTTVIVTEDSEATVVVTKADTEIVIVKESAGQGPKGDKGDTPEVAEYNQANATIVAGVLTLDCDDATTYFVAMDQNITSLVFTNRPPNGKSQRVALYLQQDATGGRTLNGFPSGTKWADASPAVLSAGANDIDCLIFDIFGQAGSIFANLVGNAYA